MRRRQRGGQDNSNSGWLYADMLLGLLFVFLASSSINSSESAVPAPRVKSVTSMVANGEYGLGSEIDVLIEFDQPVTAIGEVKLQMETNNGAKFARLMTNTPNEVLKFVFTVESGDTTSDLDYFDNQSLVTEQFGEVSSLGGKSAVLNLPNLAVSGLSPSTKTLSLIMRSRLALNLNVLRI